MNDLLDLPLFTEDQRTFARELDVFARQASWADPEQDDAAALKGALGVLGRAGVLKHALSEPWSMRANVLAREVLAYHSGIADLAWAMQALGGVPLLIAGTDEQRRQILPKAESGELCLGFAITEPDAGSDLSRLGLRASKAGSEYFLTGEKHLVSNVGVADFFVLFARTSDDRRGVSAFLLPTNVPGLNFELQRPLSPHPLGRLMLNRVNLSASALIGKEGDGMSIALGTLGRMRTTVAAAANGFARRALDEALKHARSREMFGKTLSVQPIAQGILAEMQARLDASRLLTYRAAYDFDSGAERIPMQAGIAKWQSTENAQWIIDKALQLGGGLAALHGSIFERLYREIRPLRIYEGASEIQQLVIASEMLKETNDV